ncbi:unnamed protein product [Amoebophrya sp. A120]|nr:unnamed protein product [Amoebophrya sp. A120]|eukprot:GSA120T00002990001.1
MARDVVDGEAASLNVKNDEDHAAQQPGASCRVRFSFETFGRPTGEFTIECFRDWAPHSYDRFLQLAKEDFFQGQHFVRAIENFVLDFGYGPACGTRCKEDETAALYEQLPWFFPNECEKKAGAQQQPNRLGTICFGQEENGSTKTEVFINLAHNQDKLDCRGFWPFGRVVSYRRTGADSQAVSELTKRHEIVKAWQSGDIMFDHGDIFFAGGASTEKAMVRQQVLIAGGADYIKKQHPSLSLISDVAVTEVS